VLGHSNKSLASDMGAFILLAMAQIVN